MTEYCLSFAKQQSLKVQENILLIEKGKPAWQAGRLNLPGGHVEKGEDPIYAACRELYEESSIHADPFASSILGYVQGEDFEITVVKCVYGLYHFGEIQSASSPTDEKIEVLNYREALVDARLIENLRLIIPLCMAGSSGWTFEAESFDGEEFTWKTRLVHR